MLVFINGISGAGKSAVCAELIARGQESHDADNGIAKWRRKSDRAEVFPDTAEVHNADWFDDHDWVVDRAWVEQLAKRSESRTVFVCGTYSNEVELWDLFDHVIHLSIDEPTLRHRIATRDTNDWGKAPHELDGLLQWLKTVADDNHRFGAHVVDATQPLNAVIDEILSKVQS